MAYIPTASRILGAAAFSLSVAMTAVVGSAAPALADADYVVQPGDTLSVIAKRSGLSTRDLAAANSITNYQLIRVGQKLTVPSSTTQYTVRSGDTLSGIAKRMGVRSADLIALNNLSDPHRIRIGQKLQVPSSKAPAAPSTRRYPSLPARIVNNPDRLALVGSFEKWSATYGVPTDLLMAVCYQESGWQAGIVSNKGAVGVGQLLPPTAAWVARDLIGQPGLDLNNPDDNIRVSARFLRWLLGYHGDENLAIAGYYQGPTSVANRGLFPETEAYVEAVQAGRWRFRSS
ncbi:MAG: LysM peptidoglycan-binding domain-containing protein [Acidimicrobiia bacterium]|nr:LysM peptidoglycan-binding domain-containing protein [Acidimicrobiia bacterium]